MGAEQSHELHSWSGLQYYQNWPALLGGMKFPMTPLAIGTDKGGGRGGGFALCE